LGGYVLPGTYKVVLTVVDMLGARGTDTQEIEAIDCDTGPDLELYGSCGASGVWHSVDAGVSWDDVSTETLLDTEVYDLKVNPFTIGTDHLELWAASELGLYKTIDAAGSWAKVILPSPDGGLIPVVRSIVCSTVDPSEIYALADRVTGGVWLYRTIDSGLTWTHVQLYGQSDVVDSGIYAGSVHFATHLFAQHDDGSGSGTEIYCGHALNMFNVLRRRGGWANISGGAADARALASHNGELWAAGNLALRRWNGAAWNLVNGNDYLDLLKLSNGQLAASRQNFLDFYTGNVITSSIGLPAGYYGNALYESTNGTLFVGGYRGSTKKIWRVSGAVLVEEYSDSSGRRIEQFAQDGNGWLYASDRHTMLLQRFGTSWAYRGASCPDDISGIYWHNGYLYAGNSDGTTGAVHRRIGNTWQKSMDLNWFNRSDFMYHEGTLYFARGSSSLRIYRIATDDVLTIPLVGRTHLLAMSSDGIWVYAGLLNGSGQPVMLRVMWDLDGVDTIHDPGAGTWGGVRCDYNHPEQVYLFGDFGAASKALISDDNCDTFTDITEGTWAANEVVRCVLPSIYDHNDIIAILSTDQESWHSGDAGTTWIKTGDIPYGVHCGERDWIDEFNVFVGRVDPGAEHIRYSPNNGVHWYEHSGGFEPNAPVTALQIVA
jgi:hypothetical protein